MVRLVETDEGTWKKVPCNEERKKRILKRLAQALKEAEVFWDIPAFPLKQRGEMM